jgi:hypothetical protein
VGQDRDCSLPTHANASKCLPAPARAAYPCSNELTHMHGLLCMYAQTRDRGRMNQPLNKSSETWNALRFSFLFLQWQERSGAFELTPWTRRLAWSALASPCPPRSVLESEAKA